MSFGRSVTDQVSQDDGSKEVRRFPTRHQNTVLAIGVVHKLYSHAGRCRRCRRATLNEEAASSRFKVKEMCCRGPLLIILQMARTKCSNPRNDSVCLQFMAKFVCVCVVCIALNDDSKFDTLSDWLAAKNPHARSCNPI